MMLDRKTAPSTSIDLELKLPEARMYTLTNGAPMRMLVGGTQQLIRLDLLFRAGLVENGSVPVATATAALSDAGTSKLDAFSIAEKFDYFGAYVLHHCSEDHASVTIYCLKQHFNAILDLAARVFSEPSFPEDQVNQHILQSRKQIQLSREKVSSLARQHFMKSLYGSHPLGYIATEEDLEEINSPALQHYYRENYLAGLTGVLLSGLPDEEDLNRVEHFVKTCGFTYRELEKKVEIAPYTPTRQFIEKAEAVQNAILIGTRTIPRRHPDYFNLIILNSLLGGYFGSRLMSNIREDKGYTYGIGSGLKSFRSEGLLTISTETGSSVYPDALKEIYLEINRLHNELVPESELQRVKNNLLGSVQRGMDGPLLQAEMHKMLLLNQLDTGYYDRFHETIRNCRAEDLQKCARLYLNPVDLSETVVGR